MIKAGVIGYPVKHSKSPRIHGTWLKEYGINGSYESVEIAPDNFEATIKELITEGYKGFNVTIPHKINIMTLCDTIDETAKAIGAVNTVTVDENGKLTGYNTDSFGFIENLKEKQPAINFNNGSALLIGAGGAARACAYGLLKEGIKKLYLTNRTRQKAETIAEDLKSYGDIEIINWDNRNAFPEDLILLANTTALGMEGQPSLDIDLSNLNRNCIVYDIVYAPLITPLLAQAQDKGHPIVTGIGMLLHQARPGFQKWFGTSDMPKVSAELEEVILR